METLLSASQAAQRLKVSAKTVRGWLKAGRLRGRMVGNRWVIEEPSVAAMERQRRKHRPGYMRDWA